MLTNIEYAKEHEVPEVLSADIEPFAMFTIDMGNVKKCVGRNANGKRILENAHPHLAGKYLWNVKPVPVMSVSAMRKMQEEEAEKDRKARLELYISRGYAFETKEREEEDKV